MTKPAFKLSLQPYHDTLPIYFNYDDFSANFPNENHDYIPSGRCYMDNITNRYAVYIGDGYDCNTVAHELLHIALYLLQYRGVSTTADEPEPICYFYGYLVSQYYDQLRKLKK